MAFLGNFLQLMLLLLVPTVVLGLLIRPVYRLFCYLIGVESGRRLLLCLHVPFTPIRELSHLLAAALCGHRITGFRLLRLNAPDGELGFVEHTYRKSNPITALGNLFFALWPALGVVLVALLALRLLLPEIAAALSASTAGFGTAMSLGEVLATVGTLFSEIFGNFQHRLVLKIVFLLIAALLCLGAFVAPDELVHALPGGVVLAVLTAAYTLLCDLLDPRLGRVMLGSVREFCAVTLSLHLLLLLLALLMLAFGALFFIFRMLFGMDRRYWRRRYAAEDEPEESPMAPDEADYAAPGDDDAPPEETEIVWR